MNNKAILAFLVCFLLVASNEMQGGEAKLCRRPSGLVSGLCFNTDDDCKSHCVNRENAHTGACDGLLRRCICYFKCDKI
uniref:Pit1 protein n=1 Tax=Solanum tuberosum TaxID=4113 RepID=M1AFY2_SOLTU